MNVLVTGGAGYIGAHVNLSLRENGFDTIVLDNLSTGFCEAVLDSELAQIDLANTDALGSLFSSRQFDAVIHLAAKVVVPESMQKPVDYFYSNTVNTLRLLEMVVKYNVGKFVFSSTAAVYGNPDNAVVDEDALLNPINPYGTSKLLSEHMVRDICIAHNLSYVNLRYFNVAGADPQGRIGQSTQGATHLIKVASEVATGKRASMQIFGDDYPTPDGTCVRDYIHVSDLANGHVDALNYLSKGGPSVTLNCGYGRGFSVKEVISTVERISGTKLNVGKAPRRPGDSASLVAANKKILLELGWEPKYDNLDEIVRHALNWENNARY